MAVMFDPKELEEKYRECSDRIGEMAKEAAALIEDLESMYKGGGNLDKYRAMINIYQELSKELLNDAESINKYCNTAEVYASPYTGDFFV